MQDVVRYGNISLSPIFILFRQCFPVFFSRGYILFGNERDAEQKKLRFSFSA